MELIRFRARHWVGFTQNMGVEEIDIDFSGRNGLVAITGENGMGKSTLLELLSPYRGFVSRKGKFNDHVTSREAFKEITVRVDDKVMVFLVKVDGGSSRAEGFIYRDDIPLVKGKLGEYDKMVAEIFGSPELFYNSVFTAQRGRKKLNEMPTGEIKALFIEFLRLNRYWDYEDRCKAARDFFMGKVEEAEALLKGFRSQKEVEDLQATLELTLSNRSRIEAQRAVAQHHIEEQEAEVAAIAKEAAADESLRENHRQKTAQCRRERDRIDALKTPLIEARQVLCDRRLALGGEVAVANAFREIEASLPGLREAVLSLAADNQRQDELGRQQRETSERKIAIDNHLAEMEEGYKRDAQARLDTKERLKREKRDLKGEVEALTISINAAQSRLDVMGGKESETRKRIEVLSKGYARCQDRLVETTTEEMAMRNREETLTGHRHEITLLRDAYDQLHRERSAASEISFPGQTQLDRLIREEGISRAQQEGLDGIDPLCESTVCRFITDARSAEKLVLSLQEGINTLEQEKIAFNAAKQSQIEILDQEMAHIEAEGKVWSEAEESEANRLQEDRARLARERAEIVESQQSIELERRRWEGELDTLVDQGDKDRITANRRGELASLFARVGDKSQESRCVVEEIDRMKTGFLKIWEKSLAEAHRLTAELEILAEKYHPAITDRYAGARDRLALEEGRMENLRERKAQFAEIAHEEIHLKREQARVEEEATSIQRLTDEVANIERQFHPTIAEVLTVKRENLSVLREKLEETGESLREAAVSETRARVAMEGAREEEVKRDSLNSQVTTYRGEVAEWEQLRRFVSKEGLQALEIDAASPLIEEVTNRLLENAFDGMFAIEIVTSDPETGAEVFHIMVTRNIDGSVCNLRDLSGGEQVWVLKALRLGLSMVSRTMSGKVIRTAFADEEESALHAKKAPAYVQLYRVFLAIGGFYSCLLVTHNEQIISLCDHHLCLRSGGPAWLA